MYEKKMNDNNKVMNKLLLLSKLVHKHITPIILAEKKELTPLQFRTLFYLNKKQISMSDLKKNMLISKQQLTALIDSLVILDLIRRKLDTTDRRYINLEVTENGKKFIKKAKKNIQLQLSKKFNHFTDDDVLLLITSIDNLEKLLEK